MAVKSIRIKMDNEKNSGTFWKEYKADFKMAFLKK